MHKQDARDFVSAVREKDHTTFQLPPYLTVLPTAFRCGNGCPNGGSVIGDTIPFGAKGGILDIKDPVEWWFIGPRLCRACQKMFTVLIPCVGYIGYLGVGVRRLSVGPPDGGNNITWGVVLAE